AANSAPSTSIRLAGFASFLSRLMCALRPFIGIAPHPTCRRGALPPSGVESSSRVAQHCRLDPLSKVADLLYVSSRKCLGFRRARHEEERVLADFAFNPCTVSDGGEYHGYYKRAEGEALI